MPGMSCPNPGEHDAGDMLAVHRHAASYLKTMYDAAGARAVLLISLRCGCIVSHSSLRELDTERLVMAAAGARPLEQRTQ